MVVKQGRKIDGWWGAAVVDGPRGGFGGGCWLGCVWVSVWVIGFFNLFLKLESDAEGKRTECERQTRGKTKIE